MSGRQENTFRIEEKIKKDLLDEPKVLTDFFYSMTNKTANTKRTYIGYVRDFLHWIGDDYIIANRNTINQYMEIIRYRTDKNGNKIENGASIRRARLAGITAFYDFLIEEEIIENNPCATVKPPTQNQDKEVVFMDSDEVGKLRNNIKWSDRPSKWRDRDMAIIMLGCSTGLRVTAISEINISDIDMENNSIKVVEKGNKERIVYFGDNTRKALVRWLRRRSTIKATNEDALFVSQKGGRLASRSIYDMITKYTADFDKHITPHKMRSTCATNLYEKTHDIYMVQAVLGHKNIANTRRYANVSVKERRNAAEILDAI